MAIYIAVCDDIIGDRKQMERLLNREKDARIASEVLYIDSFGSIDALMKTPFRYNLFLIDIVSPTYCGMDVAKELRNQGITAPIVLMSSRIDYTSYGNSPGNITYLTKPVTQGQVAHLVDIASDHVKERVPLIEVRDDKNSHFLPYTDIVYIKEVGDVMEFLLSNGEMITSRCKPKTIISQLIEKKCFYKCNKTIVNLLHVISSSKTTLELSSGDKVKFSIFDRKNLLMCLAGIQNRTPKK